MELASHHVVPADPSEARGTPVASPPGHENHSNVCKCLKPESRLVDAKGVVARYVRLYSNGNNADEMNH
jgi:hypothetical protein